jgi:arylsulfatase
MKRRDVLKLAALLPGLMVNPSTALPQSPAAPSNSDKPNVLILVFDTLSASHLSLHGYPRETTPNLARVAERATVYHRHYSAGNFTNPGTASLLTGTYPWRHRSFALFSPVAKKYERRSVFSAFGPEYYTLAYTHNLIAFMLIYRFLRDLNELKPIRDLCIYDQQFSDRLFLKDYDLAVLGEQLWVETSVANFFSGHQRWNHVKRRLREAYQSQFPRGLPCVFEKIFILDHAIDWLRDNLGRLPRPYLTYFHFWSPHSPYRPRKEFIGKFDGRWKPVAKPPSVFSQGETNEDLLHHRLEYDETVAYIDAEFGRLYDALEQSGELENTYLVLTSDHGELFERGIWQHTTQVLYEPVIKVPLLIIQPGQTERVDIHTPTSAVDVLPTLLSTTGQPVPDWCEGNILPGFRTESTEHLAHSVYALEAKQASRFGPLMPRTVALMRESYKLIHYFGYEEQPDAYELYDIVNDPEELVDLYPEAGWVAEDLREELLDKIAEINRLEV